MIRLSILLLLLAALSPPSSAQLGNSSEETRAFTPKGANDNLRSDTLDILNYSINLDITDFVGKTIKGNCGIRFTAKLNSIDNLTLDLLKMNIDSVTYEGTTAGYSYDDTTLLVTISPPINILDTSEVIVYYNGSPQQDPSGWGGFYWSGGYSFNLGVGFQSDPHNYGRVWFPCFDNFVERSTYDFTILTNNNKVAYCGGYLDNEVTIGPDTTVRTWILDEPIPTYLASVAVNEYTDVIWDYTSISTATIPMLLTAVSNDTTPMKASFQHLPDAMTAFENGYGAYAWDRVGFVLVPFGSGAMEHATNIAYPRSLANGTLANETLMAHELSHHWWGNLVTCRNAEEMWINEGMASYSERLFTEQVYGYDAYLNAVYDNHKDVLHNAHVKDGAYYALAAVPHAVTYGDHSYNKGSDVAHSLRGYIGDTDFFNGLTSFLAANQFSDVSSADFRDHLNTLSGVNVTDFFNDWIFNPGFAQFSVDSTEVMLNGSNYDVVVHVKQRLTAAPAFFNSVPLTVTFKDASWVEHTEQVVVSGETSSFSFTIPINPVFTALNMDKKISDATTADVVTLTSAGTTNLSFARMTVKVTDIVDSAFVRIVHNWVGPDPLTPVSNELVLAPNRYWNVDGILPSTFVATGRISFDGTTGPNGNLDNYWLKDTNGVVFTEDNIVVMYRRDASESWAEWSDYTLSTMGTTTNKSGYCIINKLALGEYSFALRYAGFGIEEEAVLKGELTVYPNPSADIFNIELKGGTGEKLLLTITDSSGREVFRSEKFRKHTTVKATSWESGLYLINVTDKFGSSKVTRSIKVE